MDDYFKKNNNQKHISFFHLLFITKTELKNLNLNEHNYLSLFNNLKKNITK